MDNKKTEANKDGASSGLALATGSASSLCPFCAGSHKHYPACVIMRAIPKPWGGPRWCDVLVKRQLTLGPLLWRCVCEGGSEHLVRFEPGESVAIQAARLMIWPLSPHRKPNNV
jgi:hypothetical protein